MFKKVLALILTLAMAFTLVACGGGSGSGDSDASAPSTESNAPEEGSGEDSGKKLIGVCVGNAADVWATYWMAAVEEYAAQFPEYQFVFQDAGNYDLANQIAQVENMINNGAEAIIMIPADAAGSQTITEACNAADVPLIVAQIKLTNQEDATALAASDAYEGGMIQSEYALEEVLNGEGKIVILQGVAGNDNATYRHQATLEVAARHPGIEVVADEIANWERSQAMTVMETWIQAGLEFDCVMAGNDEMAIGASLALQAADRRDGVLIVGFDATSEGLAAILDGSIDVTLQLDAVGQAQAAVDLAVAAVEGTMTENEIMVPNTLITIENAADFVEDTSAIKG